MSAALELAVEYQRFPTAQEIAERAGVAIRSVFHHFPDLDALFTEAADTQAAQHWVLLRRPDPDLSLSDRLELAVAQRAELYERIGPLRRVAVMHQDESPTLRRRLQESRAALRRHLRLALSPEIDGLDRISAAALEAAASWETWEVLRRDQRLSAAAASAAVTALLASTLDRSLQTAI